VTAEKKEMVDEAQRMITTIRQMEASLDDNKPRRDYQSDEDELKVTFPLTRCLQVLKERHIQVSRLHRERYEQVKSMSRHQVLHFSSNPLTPVCRARPSPRVLLIPSGADFRKTPAAPHRAEPVDTSQL
jgi:protein regulator of cytokinesis 1